MTPRPYLGGVAPRHLLDVADLTDADIAAAITDPLPASLAAGTTVGLLFLSSSLRTRLGFAAAAVRLGAVPLFVDERRDTTAMSTHESTHDTLRTVAGMVDLVVIRPAEPLDRDMARSMPVPVVNGGDPGGEHPTQALIDLAAIERFVGPVSRLRVGVCGDLTMRASRSLLALLQRRQPAELVLIAPPSRRGHGVELTMPVQVREEADFAGLDVVLMTGLAPAGDAGLDDVARSRYALTRDTIVSLESHAVVLSPMPVIDEIDEHLRQHDPRVRIYDQSDLGVAVRAAVIGRLLG